MKLCDCIEGTARASLSALFLLSLSGCGDPLKEAQEIEEPRVLAVRVAAPNDEATLIPGEIAEIEVLLAGPKGNREAKLAYSFCEALESARGVPLCEGAAFREGKVDLDGSAFSVAMPRDLDSGKRLALLGVACLKGDPALSEDPLDWNCSGEEEALKFSFDAWIESGDLKNHNPDLSSVSVEVGGVEVPLDQPNTKAACTDDAAWVKRGKTHDVEIFLGDGAREEVIDADEKTVEHLQVSHFSTEGSYERQFSFIDADDAGEVTVEWEGPNKEVAVKNYLVVRDDRGGASWVSYSFCTR